MGMAVMWFILPLLGEFVEFETRGAVVGLTESFGLELDTNIAEPSQKIRTTIPLITIKSFTHLANPITNGGVGRREQAIRNFLKTWLYQIQLAKPWLADTMITMRWQPSTQMVMSTTSMAQAKVGIGITMNTTCWWKRLSQGSKLSK